MSLAVMYLDSLDFMNYSVITMNYSVTTNESEDFKCGIWALQVVQQMLICLFYADQQDFHFNASFLPQL